MKLQKLLQRLKRFMRDQGGMEALQTVTITAIAATVMVGAAGVAKKGGDMMQERWGEISKESDSLKEAVQKAVGDAASDAAGDIIDEVTN